MIDLDEILEASNKKTVKAEKISGNEYSVLFEDNFTLLPDKETIIGVECNTKENLTRKGAPV